MKLYKNVPVEDLESILKNGILPANQVEYDRWDSGNRAPNSQDVVYLFNPISKKNTFESYGLILLEVECNATKNQMHERDHYRNTYEEYIIDEVKTSQIKRVIAPALLKERIKGMLTEEVFNKIEFVKMTAKICSHLEKIAPCEYQMIYKNAPDEVLDQFAKTAYIDIEEGNYFRGTKVDGDVLDLEEVRYIF